MSLSCSCYDEGEWYYIGPSDFTPLSTSRRKRCCSCKQLIDKEADCLIFGRHREPYTDIEASICGDEVWMADWHMCESCGEIYMALEDLGFCVYLSDDMRNNLKEYQTEYAHPAWGTFKGCDSIP